MRKLRNVPCTRFPRGPMVKQDLTEETPPPNPFDQISHFSPGALRPRGTSSSLGELYPGWDKNPQLWSRPSTPRPAPEDRAGEEPDPSLPAVRLAQHTKDGEVRMLQRGSERDSAQVPLGCWEDRSVSLPLRRSGQGIWTVAARGSRSQLTEESQAVAEPEA